MSLTSAPLRANWPAGSFGKDVHMHSESPLNLESSLDLLTEATTPIEHFFLRNNHAIPTITPAAWALTIDGHVARPYTLSYAALRDLPAVPDWGGINWVK